MCFILLNSSQKAMCVSYYLDSASHRIIIVLTLHRRISTL